MARKEATATVEVTNPTTVILQSQYDLIEPEFNIRLVQGVPTVVPAISTWLQYQIDAGIVVVS